MLVPDLLSEICLFYKRLYLYQTKTSSELQTRQETICLPLHFYIILLFLSLYFLFVMLSKYFLDKKKIEEKNTRSE